MVATEWILDLVIGLLILLLAAGALYAKTIYGCLALFLTFGIVLTLAWARLGAPDLALAEAAIGAGLTGALLFNALRDTPPDRPYALKPRQWLLASLFTVLVLALVLHAVWPTAQLEPVLPEQVAQHIDDSGVTHPVTAVLLNFRSWDTVLELAVLLVALLGVKIVVPSTTSSPQPWAVLLAWSKTLAPLIVLAGGYILWRGASAPGGAFQAGALLAAGAVVLRLNHLLPALRWSLWPLRLSVLAGLIIFLVVAVTTLLTGRGWLDYPTEYSGALIKVVEVLATLSIATSLTLLIVGDEEELHS